MFVDDGDEFAQHRVEFGYPPEVVTAVEDSCRAVLDAVRAGTAPFDGPTARRWLGALAALR